MAPHPKIQKDVSTTLHTLLRPLLKRTLPFSPFTYRNEKFATSFTHCFFYKMVPKTVVPKSRFIYKNHLKWRLVFSLEKMCKKRTKNHVPGIHLGSRSCWKTILFRSKIMYFHNKNRVKKLHLHSWNRFCLNFFSQS